MSRRALQSFCRLVLKKSCLLVIWAFFLVNHHLLDDAHKRTEECYCSGMKYTIVEETS
jgi:hypothetical protein